MAYVGASMDFDLDDDGILRDSLNGTDLLIDEDGIVRDHDLELFKQTSRSHWTDSGIGGDKQSSSSTLQHLQNSFEEDLAPIEDESINISEFEASKDDDLSFEGPDDENTSNTRKRAKMLDTLGSTLEKPPGIEDEPPAKQEKMMASSKISIVGNTRKYDRQTTESDNAPLFSEEYYQQLRDLGVLVDGVDLSRDSLNEFGEMESTMTSRPGYENKNSQDLIEEYLESEYRREEDENVEGLEISGAKSAGTINSRSFPETGGEDYDDEGLSQTSGGQGGAQRTDGDDVEISDITSRIPFPSSGANSENDHHHQQVSREQHLVSPDSRSGSRTNSPQSFKHGPAPSSSALYGQRRLDEDARSVHSDSAYARSRPSSTTSHLSTASEIVSARQKRAENIATQRMSKSKSQENFFEGGPKFQSSSPEKSYQKRLLPTPSHSEPSQSFKLKSRTVSQASRTSGPVKPKHSPGSEASQVSEWDAAGEVSEESAEELTERLTLEAQKRKQATELVQQLQKDYDSLLTKYALAELTIDHMRLGAKITLHNDSPTPGIAQSGVISPGLGQSAQVMSLRHSPNQATVMRNSPLPGVMGHMSPFKDGNDLFDGRHSSIPGDQRSRSQPEFQSISSNFSSQQSVAKSENGSQEDNETGTESVKSSLMAQAKIMDERLESFCTFLEQRQLTLGEQEQVFELIKSDHDKLRRVYLQAKDDYNVLRRSGALTNDAYNFDPNKELEGYLFRLGMRFDEVHEQVEKNLQEKAKHRQPFQPDSNRADDEKRKGHGDDFLDGQGGGSVAVDQRNSHNISQIISEEDSAFEQHIYQLRKEYNGCMDAYRKLEFMANTPEGERQIENVVRRLNDICTEMPDMFRLSPSVQTRCDQMQNENRLKLNERKNSVWEKLNKREQEMKQQRRSPVPSILRQGSELSDSDSLRARLDESTRLSLGSILPDRMERPQPRSNSVIDRPSSRSSIDRPSSYNSNRSYSSHDPDRPISRSRARGGDSSFSDSLDNGHDFSNANLPRPRRHEHGIRDPKLSQMPGMSLLGSGFGSRHHRSGSPDEGDRGANGGGGAKGGRGDLEGALAALPGPGKLKQMTKMRAAEDADSGFVGSMVGSGVGEHPATQKQQQQQLQQQQQEVSLRLMRAAASDSSTITDQSQDTSAEADGRPRTHQGQEPGQGRERDKIRGTRRAEESYDGEEDSVGALESDISLRKGVDGATPKIRREQDRHMEKERPSLDDTLEENDSEQESDVSTPRAIDQSLPNARGNKKLGSGQVPVGQKTPVKMKGRSSGAQAASEEELHGGLSVSIAQPGQSEGASDKAETTQHKRLKSPPPLVRPSSRGSPTTDLFRTRERRASGDWDSRQGTGSGVEVNRHERQKATTQRGEIRLGRSDPKVERPSSQHRSESGVGLDPSLTLTHEPQNTKIAGRMKEFEERSVGSDVEVGSNITRTSSVASSNNRLKALQEEVEKLKESMARANEKASHSPAPPPLPQLYHVPAPEQPAQDSRRQEPEYYDPFDDPYGFMRVPRRRANSFSGGREREWAEWYWSLPQNQQYDGGDIPLGYAAADAYAENIQTQNVPNRERNTQEAVKNRLQQRRMDHRHGSVQPAESGPAVDAAASTPLVGDTGLTSGQTAAAMYDYYVPSRYSTQGMRQQMAFQGYFTTPSGAKIYSSTGEEADNEEEEEHGGVSAAGAGAQTHNNQPWYQIRRATRPFTRQYGLGRVSAPLIDSRHARSQEDINSKNQGQVRATQGVAYTYRTAAQACPMCGGSGFHTHTNHIHAGHAYSPSAPPHYAAHDFERTSRSRSHSVSSTHHYSPDGFSSRTQYKEREYRHLSDSDVEERNSSRSPSLSRGRSRTRSRNRHENTQYRRSSESLSDLSGDEEISLDHSLSLSMDISRLTNKMLGTLRTELKRSKDKREFGSSYW